MKLYRRNNYNEEFVCYLTRELDKVSGISENQHYRLFHHYILADEWSMNNKCLAIRVPGGTVGGVWITENNVITKIVVDTNYVVKTYPDDVNEVMEKYVGEIIKFEDNL